MILLGSVYRVLFRKCFDVNNSVKVHSTLSCGLFMGSDPII